MTKKKELSIKDIKELSTATKFFMVDEDNGVYPVILNEDQEDCRVCGKNKETFFINENITDFSEDFCICKDCINGFYHLINNLKNK